MKNEENKKEAIQLFVRLKVLRKDGSVKYDSGKRKSKCFVLQFLQIVCCGFKAGYGSPTAKDVTGANRTLYRTWAPIDAPSGNANYGIVVGTGTTPVTNSDYKLESQITHGTGANQMLHGSMGFTAPTVIDNNIDFVMERSFTNASGSTITVNEVGLYVKYWDGSAHRYFCAIRDLTGGINVGDGEILVVEYTVRVTP